MVKSGIIIIIIEPQQGLKLKLHSSVQTDVIKGYSLVW